MKIRSGFKKNNKLITRSTRSLWFMLKRWNKKMLSFNVLKAKGIKKHQKKRFRSYLKRDIHKRKFENPYRKKKKSPKFILDFMRNRRYHIAPIALVLISVAWFAVVFMSRSFYLTTVRITGNREINTEDVYKVVSKYLAGRNFVMVRHAHYLFLNKRKLERIIRDQYNLEAIIFDPHWPSNTLSVRIKEKESMALYSVDESYYSVDRYGLIIREIANPEEFKLSEDIPMIYQYDSDQNTSVGSAVLNQVSIDVITHLNQELQKYPFFNVHSFRLKNAQKREIHISDKRPVPEKNKESENENHEDSLADDVNNIARAIVDAESIEDKIEKIKALENIDIEKLEEGNMDKVFEKEKIYLPDDAYQIQELEVYTKQGWSIKLGHKILNDKALAENILLIFATLNRKIDLGEEVKEYIDLRFPDRVYYR